MDKQITDGRTPAVIAAEAFQSLRLLTHVTLSGLIAIVAARRRRRPPGTFEGTVFVKTEDGLVFPLLAEEDLRGAVD